MRLLPLHVTPSRGKIVSSYLVLREWLVSHSGGYANQIRRLGGRVIYWPQGCPNYWSVVYIKAFRVPSLHQYDLFAL